MQILILWETNAVLHIHLQPPHDQVPLILSLPKVTSPVAQMVKRLPTRQETWVRSLGWEDLLEKEIVTHSSILAWKIPWMEEPGRLQSMGSQRVGHNWATKPIKLDVCVGKIPWRRERLSTPGFWPGEFYGQSMGSQRVGHDWATFTHFTRCDLGTQHCGLDKEWTAKTSQWWTSRPIQPPSATPHGSRRQTSPLTTQQAIPLN